MDQDHSIQLIIEHYIKKSDEQVKEKIFILNEKESKDGCVQFKKFSNNRVNFSQVTAYPSTIFPNYELTIPTLYLIYGSEVGIVSSYIGGG